MCGQRRQQTPFAANPFPAPLARAFSLMWDERNHVEPAPPNIGEGLELLLAVLDGLKTWYDGLAKWPTAGG
jgi:hypothetical protein